jgi:hypothetical protein
MAITVIDCDPSLEIIARAGYFLTDRFWNGDDSRRLCHINFILQLYLAILKQQKGAPLQMETTKVRQRGKGDLTDKS